MIIKMLSRKNLLQDIQTSAELLLGFVKLESRVDPFRNSAEFHGREHCDIMKKFTAESAATWGATQIGRSSQRTKWQWPPRPVGRATAHTNASSKSQVRTRVWVSCFVLDSCFGSEI
ncbi:hypothetical protein ACOSQ4_031410 [Xanthoceras sorbifolium]